MTHVTTVFFTLLITVATVSGLAQTVDPIEELKACAKMTDRDARFACFDNLGERVLREESTDQKPTPESATQPEAVTTATATNAQPPPEVLDMSMIGDDQEPKSISYSRVVTSCQKGVYGDWYFFFDNGQVWKYVGNRNLRFKECNFNVTVTKDFFGFKMQGDDLEKTVRIRRHK